MIKQPASNASTLRTNRSKTASDDDTATSSLVSALATPRKTRSGKVLNPPEASTVSRDTEISTTASESTDWNATDAEFVDAVVDAAAFEDVADEDKVSPTR